MLRITFLASKVELVISNVGGVYLLLFFFFNIKAFAFYDGPLVLLFKKKGIALGPSVSNLDDTSLTCLFCIN